MPIKSYQNRQFHAYKQTIPCLKDSVSLGRVRTQPTVKRFKKRFKKREGQNFPPKNHSFFPQTGSRNFLNCKSCSLRSLKKVCSLRSHIVLRSRLKAPLLKPLFKEVFVRL
ncbi:hypothetical protein CYQ37_15670 [Enterococcus faecalis]|nr:hypothetical protein CYQ37_15670 [Enterococcus faecalis]